MANVIYLASYSNYESYKLNGEVKLPLESVITYCVHNYCDPELVDLRFIAVNEPNEANIPSFTIRNESLQFMDMKDVPWQVASCVYPVVMFDDTIITGTCAVARHICKYKTSPAAPLEHGEGLLGFRKSCLQAPNEVSIWTKFCEIDVIKTVNEILTATELREVPINLVRFENHLKKPVRIHNVYKIARNIKTDSLKSEKSSTNVSEQNGKSPNTTRIPKTRKWKSNKKKEAEIDSSTKVEDLSINHQFAEGPFLTLADLVLLPSYHMIMLGVGNLFEHLLPNTYRWYENLLTLKNVENLVLSMRVNSLRNLSIDYDIVMPATEDVSLYKCDPKRHNPKKRLFTKEEDIEKALSSIINGMELLVSSNELKASFDWKDIPDGANPTAGHLPDERVMRKSQQLENLTLAVLSIAKEGDLIVDFCSGSGHLGILIAHLLPQCTIILLENKEQSLLRARTRVHEMKLKNVYFFQCNLDFFIGKFDIGIALHACGIASDLVLDKCLKANAKFVLCPCCYGSLHATDRLVYPRSNKFGKVPIDQYLCIGHAADQTHKEHPLAVRGARCMAIIDSDRGSLAEEFGYKISLTKLKPLSCTPKNNLLIGVPT